MRAWLLGLVIATQSIGCTDAQVDRVSTAIERSSESLSRNPNIVPGGPPAPSPTRNPSPVPAGSPTTPSPVAQVTSPLDYANGIITTVVGGGKYDPHSDIPDREAVTSVYLDNPRAMAIHKDGTIYVADTFGLRRISPAGIATFVIRHAISTAWTANAGSSGPYWDVSIKLDASGDVSIGGNAIGQLQRLSSTGVPSVIAGQYKGAMPADGVRALDANLGWTVRLLHVDPEGNIYISGGRGIERIKPDGTLAWVAGNGKRSSEAPMAPATPVPVKDLTLAGTGGLTTDAMSNVYFADGGRVFRIDSTGMARLVAGTGTIGATGDGGPATLAAFYHPKGLAIAPDGTLLIADTDNARVRQVDANGIIATICGAAGDRMALGGTLGDGGPAKAAILGYPKELACMDDGTLYILTNGQVRKIVPVRQNAPGGA